MCGICGIISLSDKLSESDQENVRQMTSALIHRGPDQEGFHFSTKGVLGMRRLSIIDLAHGQQPIYNEDQSMGIVYNGEVYNFPGIRENLLLQGHRLSTHTDTEAILHLYEEKGEDLFDDLRGMYTFCIHDKVKNRTLIGRDALGEKPLYYYKDKCRLFFSSEIQSLLNAPIPRNLNLNYFSYGLKCGMVPEPHTLFEGIKILPAGHYLLIENNTVHVKRHFKQKPVQDYVYENLDQVQCDIEPVLERAIKMQMISDVPIGAFLSGGIDSSTVAYYMQKNSHRPILTFTARFEEESYDESPFAQEIADHLGTEHHTLTIPNTTFTEDVFWEIIHHVGQPFRDTSSIPTYHISKMISSYVKVALSGDGGDEIFGGYDLYRWYQKLNPLAKWPRSLLSMGSSISRTMSRLPGFNQSEQLRRIRRALEVTSGGQEQIALELHSFYTDDDLLRLYPGANILFDLLKTTTAEQSDLRTIMGYRLQHVLPGNMLIKVDRMSMAHSLEVRAPFLDRDLLIKSQSIPDHLLANDIQGKLPLRYLMKNKLPSSVFNRPKKGFGIPLHRFQNETYKKLAHELLWNKNHPLYDLLDYDECQKIKELGLSIMKNRADISLFQASHRLWYLMQLFGWFNHFKLH